MKEAAHGGPPREKGNLWCLTCVLSAANPPRPERDALRIDVIGNR